eukprot:519893_1
MEFLGMALEVHRCWTIGDNEMGQQGLGTDEEEINEIQLIEEINQIDDIHIHNISAGVYGSAYLLCNQHRMIVVGNDEHGQLGIAYHLIRIIITSWYRTYLQIPTMDIISLIISFVPQINWQNYLTNKPILIDDFPIKHISNGIASRHRFIITTNNQIYAAGDNRNKQCGIKQRDRRDEPKFNTWMKMDWFKQNKIKIIAIDCAWDYSVFLSGDGDVYTCGSSFNGIEKWFIGHNVIQICCGSNHSLLLLQNGDVWSCGFNDRGQLGRSVHSSLYHMAQDTVPRKIILSVLPQVIHIACGESFNMALGNNNRTYCWGQNTNYECGNGENTDVMDPQLNVRLAEIKIVDVKCGAYHTVARSEENRYYLWGSNDFNQCLVDEEEECITIPQEYNDAFFIERNQRIVAIYPGYNETRIVTTDILM